MLRELGIFERALLLSDRHSAFNVVTVLHLKQCPAPAIIQKALAALQERHPLLRARIAAHAGRRVSFGPIPNPSFPYAVIQRESSRQWMQVVESEMGQRFDVFSGPLFRAIYLNDEQHGEVILTFHHTIMDAASGMNLLDELLRMCAALHTGERLQLPALEVVPAIETRFPPRYAGARRILPTAAYVLSQMGDEMSYRWHARGKRIPRVQTGGRGHILTLALPEALVNALAHRARQEKLTLNSLLNATLMLAVNRRLYSGRSAPMRTFTFADLRPFTIPPTPLEALANYISMLRFTLNVSGQDDVWNLARELHQKIYRSLKHGDKFIASAMSEPLMKMFTTMKSIRMGATALNYSGAVPLQSSYGEIQVVGLHAFISAYDIGPEFASQARLFKDQLCWDFVYLDTDMDRALAERIVAEIRQILENAV